MAVVTPRPYVIINRLGMPISLVEGDAVVLDNLHISWGRKGYLEDPNPAVLNMSVLDRTGDWVKGQDLLGQEIIIGLLYTDENGVEQNYYNFRGRIVDAELDVLRPNQGTARGYIIRITATDKLTELGNRFMSNQVWPAETYDQRKARIMAVLGGVLDGIGGVYPTMSYAATSFDQKSVLELIREHMAAAGDWISFNPTTNRIEASGRSWYTAPGIVLSETNTGTNKYALMFGGMDPGEGVKRNVDCSKGIVALSGLRRNISSGVTEVRYEYCTSSAGTAKSTWIASTGLDESIYGRRALTVTTENYTDISYWGGVYLANAQDADAWEPPEMEWDTRRAGAAFSSHVQVLNFVGGREERSTFFLSRNQYNPFPRKRPLYRVVGADITYSRNSSGVGGWVVRPSFGPVTITPETFTELTWDAVNPSGSVSYDELDDNVTWDDISRADQGV